jgi:dTDP-glucose 4,6-dehydratase
MTTNFITGAAGFLGVHVVQQRLRSHPQDRFVLLDNFSHGAHPAQMMSLTDHDRVISVVGDVRDGALVSDLIRSHDVTQIIHCAALDATACQTLDAAAIMDNNVNGTLMLLEAARLVWSQKALRDTHFHYVSCADALAPTEAGSISDEGCGAPETLYAASKLNAENLVIAFAHRHHLRASVSRPTTMYGPRQFPANLVASTVIAILEGRRLPLYGAGSQSLNLLHVQDAARGIDAALGQAKPFSRFGLAGETTTMRDLVGLICRSVDHYALQQKDFAAAFKRSPAASNLPSSTLITMVQDRRIVARARSHDFTAAQEQFSYAPHEKLHDAISSTIAWYAQNADWWRSVQNGQHQTRADFALAS